MMFLLMMTMMMMTMMMMMTPLPHISSFVVVPTTTTNSNKIYHHQQEQRNYYFKPLKAAAVGEGVDITNDDNNNNNNENENENENDNLTKEELLLRLAETRQYYRDNIKKLGVEDTELCLRLLSTRFSELQLNRCTVQESTIQNGGNGLFASRNIKNGELITLYPGDAVIIRKDDQEQEQQGNDQGDNKKNKKKSMPLITNVMFGDHIAIQDRKIDRVLTYDSRGYETELNDYISIIGDPNYSNSNNNILPGQIQYDTSYCAHYANDGAYLNDFDSTKRELYYKNTVSNYNSANFIMEDGAHVGMVATKDIGKDQEIFLSYGEGYWLSRISSALKDNNSAKNGTGSSSNGNGAAAATATTTTTKEEAENMLTDIMSDMSERRKNVVNKKATTLTSSMLSTASAMANVVGGGGFKKSSDNNANKKKNKNKNKKNSKRGSTSSEGFAK